MTHRFAAISLALGALVPPCAARAETPWYISGSAGGYFREDDTAKTTFTRKAFVLASPPVTPPAAASPGEIVVIGTRRPLVPVLQTFHAAGVVKQSHRPGEDLSLALGYRFSARFRVEVEAGYTAYSAGTLRPFTTSPNFPALDGRAFQQKAGGDYSSTTATLNGFYDFRPTASGWAPYVGVGVGGAATTRSAGTFVSAQGNTLHSAGGSGASGLALAEAGLNIRLTPNLTLAPAYRYVHYFNVGGDVAHVAKASLRYVF